jgi:hypothetical protein
VLAVSPVSVWDVVFAGSVTGALHVVPLSVDRARRNPVSLFELSVHVIVFDVVDAAYATTLLGAMGQGSRSPYTVPIPNVDEVPAGLIVPERCAYEPAEVCVAV